METLREYVGRQLRDTLHGKEIDMMQAVKPRLPHMLGLLEIGEVIGPSDVDGSILDPTHEFWDNYYKEVNTRNKAEEEVISAVESLKADGLFRMSYPYGEEGGIVYVEVERPELYSERVAGNNSITTPCKECGQTLRTAPRLVLYSDSYHIKFSLNCDECGFDESYRRRLMEE